jgi:hypothetical protein
MSLKFYIALVAFDKWIKANPKGGIFVYQGKKFSVSIRDLLDLKKSSE